MSNLNVEGFRALYPTVIPRGYLSDRNVAFVQAKITEVLGREFRNPPYIPKSEIVRVMTYVGEQLTESVPRMNERAIMHITNDFRNNQAERGKHMRWEEFFPMSQRLVDPTAKTTHADYNLIQGALSNRLGVPHVGGTHQFIFL